jgi:hypothetical protein
VAADYLPGRRHEIGNRKADKTLISSITAPAHSATFLTKLFQSSDIKFSDLGFS